MQTSHALRQETLPRAARAMLVGASDQRLRELLTDIFDELGIELCTPESVADAAAGGGMVDFAVAVVGRDDLARILAEARRLTGQAPVIAILSLDDPRRAKQAIACGADAVYALDTSLGGFRTELIRLISRRSGQERPSSPSDAIVFTLGLRGRAAIS